jgi:hypothetical protein
MIWVDLRFNTDDDFNAFDPKILTPNFANDPPDDSGTDADLAP